MVWYCCTKCCWSLSILVCMLGEMYLWNYVTGGDDSNSSIESFWTEWKIVGVVDSEVLQTVYLILSLFYIVKNSGVLYHYYKCIVSLLCCCQTDALCWFIDYSIPNCLAIITIQCCFHTQSNRCTNHSYGSTICICIYRYINIYLILFVWFYSYVLFLLLFSGYTRETV